jgi:hypothetical protein
LKPAQKTGLLAAIASVLLAVVLLDPGHQQRAAEDLPVLPAIDRTLVKRIELSTAVDKVVLEALLEEGSGAETDPAERTVWQLKGATTGDADQAAVRALLANFRKEIRLDVKVDEGSGEMLEKYGLDPGQGIVVEMFGSSETPLLSFVLGMDAPGGSSYVRLSGSDQIWRARVGGRHRYARTGPEWRNRVLFGFLPEAVHRFTLLPTGGEPVTLVRPDPKSPWRLDPDPGWTADQLLINQGIEALGGLKAGEILDPNFDGGFSPPLAELQLGLADGRTASLKVGNKPLEGAFFVNNGSMVARVAEGPIRRLLLPPEAWRDRTMLALNRSDIDTLQLEQGSLRILLQQDLSNGFWRVVEPTNLDLDMKLVFFAVATLSDLRGDRLLPGSPADYGLQSPQFTVRLRLLDGTERQLKFGAPNKDAQGKTSFPVQVDAHPQVFQLGEATVAKIRAGFSQG